jgi:hypothetical protein
MAVPWAWLPALAQITPFLQLLGRQIGHLVIGAAQLEAEHGLLVLALQKHFVVQAAAEVLGNVQIRLHGHVIDACIEDASQIIGRGQGLSHGANRK